VVDGRDQVRRIDAENADLVDFPVFGMYDRSSNRIFLLGSARRPDSQQFVEHRRVGAPAVGLDEVPEGGRPSSNRSSAGFPERAAEPRSRTQPAITRAARLYARWAPRSSLAREAPDAQHLFPERGR